MGLSGVAIGTYRPQYRPLSAIRYLDANSQPTRYTLFSTLILAKDQGVLGITHLSLNMSTYHSGE
jgi:hypothetical protein